MFGGYIKVKNFVPCLPHYRNIFFILNNTGINRHPLQYRNFDKLYNIKIFIPVLFKIKKIKILVFQYCDCQSQLISNLHKINYITFCSTLDCCFLFSRQQSLFFVETKMKQMNHRLTH